MNIYLGCNERAHLLNKLYQMMTKVNLSRSITNLDRVGRKLN